MRSHRAARFRRAPRIVPLAVLAVAACTGALAQTALVGTTHTVVAQSQPPAVEHNFTVSAAGTYSVTLTDLGSKLPTPAPLASVAMAVTQGSSIVGTPVTAAGTAITFTAAASGQYTIHVVGIPGTTLGSGPIEEDVTDSGGNDVYSSIDTLSSGSSQPSGVGILDNSFTVGSSGIYTVTMTDQQFPTALQNPDLIVIDTTAGAAVATLNAFGSTQTTQALNPGDSYTILAFAQEQSGAVGGLFSVAVTPSSGAAAFGPAVVPVGAVTLLQTSVSGTSQTSFSLASSQATVALTDLTFPTVPLASLGAIVVDATTGQAVSPAVTATGQQNFTPPSTTDSYQVYAYAIPDSTANWGSYSVSVQQGTAFPFLEAQAVSSSSAMQVFSFDASAPQAGSNSYVVTLTDFKFPSAIAADGLAVVQNGSLVKGINAAGNFTASLSQGLFTILAFGQAASGSSGLMGVDVSPSGGGTAAFDTTEGIGTGFSSTTFSTTSAESVQANVSDLKFPEALGNLNLAVTSGTNLVGTIASAGSSGSFPFQASASTTYTVNVLAQPAAATNSEPEAAGTYAMSVEPAPSVTLTASPTSVASGGTVSLTWNAQNATSCTASASPSNSAWSGSETASASGGPVTSSALTADTTFTLSCTGAGGTTSGTATVTVTAASSSSGGGHGGGGSMDPELLLALAAILALRARALRADTA
jgi:hypothetical protein